MNFMITGQAGRDVYVVKYSLGNGRSPATLVFYLCERFFGKTWESSRTAWRMMIYSNIRGFYALFIAKYKKSIKWFSENTIWNSNRFIIADIKFSNRWRTSMFNCKLFSHKLLEDHSYLIQWLVRVSKKLWSSKNLSLNFTKESKRMVHLFSSRTLFLCAHECFITELFRFSDANSV